MLYTQEKNDLEHNLLLLKQYQEATDHSVIVSKTDSKGVITYVNDEFCKISEYTRDELIGKNHNIIRHPDNPKSLYADMWHTIKDLKQTWQGLLRNYTKSGGSYYVKTTVKPILSNNGDVIEYIALWDDITDVMNPKRQLNDLIESTDETVVALFRIEGFDDIENFYGSILTQAIEDKLADKLLDFEPSSNVFNRVYALGNGEYALAKNFKDCTKIY